MAFLKRKPAPPALTRRALVWIESCGYRVWITDVGVQILRDTDAPLDDGRKIKPGMIPE